MFPYYGRKKMLAPKYPAPAMGTIVEPFAGSAQYACLYPDRDVILIDRSPIIAGIWRYLIDASPSDIMALPIPAVGESLREDYASLSEPERHFLGFYICTSAAHPQDIVQPKGTWNDRSRAATARMVARIGHWRIIEGSYQDAPDVTATWFVDPPYQGNGGKYYRYSNRHIDYAHLAEWCMARRGEVIVCENEEASWLPFTKFADHHGVTNRQAAEVIYYQAPAANEDAA